MDELTIELPGRGTALVDVRPTGGTATRLQAVYAAIARRDGADRRTRIRRTARYGRPRIYQGLAERRERAEAAQERARQEQIERGRAEGVSAYYAVTGRGPAQPSAMDEHNARTRARAAALVAAEAGPAADEPRYVYPGDVATPDAEITPRQRRIEEWIGHHETLCDPAQPHAARLTAWQAIRALEAAYDAEADGMAGAPAGAARAWAWVPFDSADRWGAFAAPALQARIERAVARAVNVAALAWIEEHVQRAARTPAPNSLTSDQERGAHEGISTLYMRRPQLEGAGREAAARAWYRELQLAEWALDGIFPDAPLPAPVPVATPASNGGDGGTDDAAAAVPEIEEDDAAAAANPAPEPEPEPVPAAPAAPAAAAHVSTSWRQRWMTRLQTPRRRIAAR